VRREGGGSPSLGEEGKKTNALREENSVEESKTGMTSRPGGSIKDNLLTRKGRLKEKLR